MTHSIAWRKSTERVTMAQEILNNPSMLEMLAVIELDHPAKNRTAIHDGFGATYKLGMIDGFEQCLTMLRDLGQAAPLPPKAIVATWGSEEQTDGNK